jgi:hypothetical protein
LCEPARGQENWVAEKSGGGHNAIEPARQPNLRMKWQEYTEPRTAPFLKRVLFGLALLSAIIFFGPLGAMKTSNGFSLSSFRKLRAGDPFDHVIASLGYPLCYTVVAPPDENGN